MEGKGRAGGPTPGTVRGSVGGHRSSLLPAAMSSVRRGNVTSGECGRGTEEVSRGREEAERGCSVASPASEVPEPPRGSETPRLHGPHGPASA